MEIFQYAILIFLAVVVLMTAIATFKVIDKFERGSFSRWASSPAFVSLA